MWCRCCQQDVPGVPSQDDGELRCARCFTGLGNAISRQSGSSSLGEANSWDLEADLSRADELVRQIRGSQSPNKSNVKHRFDRPHRHSRQPGPPTATKPASGLFAWLLIALGLTGSVFGGALIVWSVLGGRSDLWPLGVPCTIGSQGVLILGLLLQLETLGRGYRATHVSLQTFQKHLRELRAEVRDHPAAPHAFYSDWADGASPEVLLADLRGQLNMLADRIRDDDRE